MIRLTKKDVEHVASLSNLKLTSEEVDKFLPQLKKIIDSISILSKVDTKDINPTDQTTGLTNVYRDDVINNENYLTQDEVFLNATDFNKFFKVSAILEERTNK